MADASSSRGHWYVLATIGLILLVPCCWLLVKWHAVRVQREAVAEIRRVGGKVGYSASQGPKWLRNVMGDGWVNDAVMVSCGDLTTDGDLEHLKGLGQLRELWLDNTKITDAGLKHLEGLAQLDTLAIDNTKISDAGLEYLGGYRDLSS